MALRPRVKVFVILTILFFVGILLSFLILLNTAREEHFNQAIHHFELTNKTIITELIRPASPTSSKAQRNEVVDQEAIFQQVRSGKPDIELYSVFYEDRGIMLFWSRPGDYIANSKMKLNSSQENPEIVFHELTQEMLSQDGEIDGKFYSIQAVYTVLSINDILPIINILFIISLSYTGLVFLGLIIHVILNRKEPQKENRPLASPNAYDVGLVSEIQKPNPVITNSKKEFEPSPIRPSTETNSPRTGFFLSSDLKTRLKSELTRSASNEIDLSLTIIVLEGVGNNIVLLKEAAEFMKEHFRYEDLIFELNANTMAIIEPYVELDTALQNVEQFLQKVNSWSLQNDITVYAGLTSRNGRLLEPERMVEEAKEALKRSRKDPGRIIGFRPDPNLYRNYLLKAQ